MDKEIRARVAKVLAEFAANEMMDDLREQKVAMLDAVEADIVPFFKARGIDITSVGQFGGFSYENTEIQKAIDNVFQAQQDQRVAVAETEAQVERNKAIQLAAEGKAAAVKAEADGKASAIQAVADARKYEIDQLQANPEMYMRLMNLEIQKAQLEKWNGTYPSTLMTMGTGETPPFILELPKQDLSKR